MNKETVMVRIDKGLRQILKMEAARRGQSMEELLNMLLRKSLKYDSKSDIARTPFSRTSTISIG